MPQGNGNIDKVGQQIEKLGEEVQKVDSYIEIVKDWLLNHGIKIFIILIVTVVVFKLLRIVVNRIQKIMQARSQDGEYQKRTETIGHIIQYAGVVTILLVMALMILKETGIEIGPVLAAAGVVGVAVGFGSQKLVQDIISGFFMLLEDQIRIGDVVEIGGKSGLVERITLRMVVLRDLQGHVHYVNNGQIDTVTNMTKDFSRYVFDIGVAYRENVDEVIEVIKQVDEDLRSDPDYEKDILEPIEILGLDKFADSAVIIKARTTTVPIQQWRVGREFNRRLKKKFDEVGIEIPFPHVTLYMGQLKDGTAPPLNIKTKGEDGQ